MQNTNKKTNNIKNNTSEVKSVFLQSRSKIFYNDYIRSLCEQEITKSSILSDVITSSGNNRGNQTFSFFSW